MSIAANIRKEIEAHGMTASGLASEIGVSAAIMRKFIAGTVRPADDVIIRIAEAVGCEPEIIKFGRGSRRIGKLTTDEVSRITGIDPLSLRIGCQRGLYPFGKAYIREGSSHFTYVYDPEALSRWTAARRALNGGLGCEKNESLPDHMGRTLD